MKLSKLKLWNYRCFGSEEQVILIDQLTTFIGNNSAGKTAALSALNCTSFNRKPPILTIVAIEEPENHIAPHLLGKLVGNLKDIAGKNNAQAIMTSHSPAIVKRIDVHFLWRYHVQRRLLHLHFAKNELA